MLSARYELLKIVCFEINKIEEYTNVRRFDRFIGVYIFFFSIRSFFNKQTSVPISHNNQREMFECPRCENSIVISKCNFAKINTAHFEIAHMK